MKIKLELGKPLIILTLERALYITLKDSVLVYLKQENIGLIPKE